jgi:hypothetical protein
MKKFLLLSVLTLLSACELDKKYDKLDGSWFLDCQIENNYVSGVNGVYSFKNGVFTADMRSCDPVAENQSVSVSFPYSYGDYVLLGEGMEARHLKIHVEPGYTVHALVYEERVSGGNDQLFWTWGFDNTSIEHSIFGFASNDTESYWGGYLVVDSGDGNYSPIKSLKGSDIDTDIKDDDYYKYGDDREYDVDKPYTVSFKAYLEED